MLFWPGSTVNGPYSKCRRVVPAGPVGGSVEVVTEGLAVVGGAAVVVGAGAALVVGAAVVGASVSLVTLVTPLLLQAAAVNPIAASATPSHRPPTHAASR